MLVPLIPFSRVRVVVGPGARDRVARNRRAMSSVIIGMLTFMTCMAPAESALSMAAHPPPQHRRVCERSESGLGLLLG
jgi:hypothetical protein